MMIAEKEASETHYRLELCDDARPGDIETRQRLLKECSELLTIFTAAGRPAKTNRGLRNAKGKSPDSTSNIHNSKSP